MKNESGENLIRSHILYTFILCKKFSRDMATKGSRKKKYFFSGPATKEKGTFKKLFLFICSR